jgi:indole-3-acetate monooxygenase
MTYAIDEKLLAEARQLGPMIREHSAEAERERRLSKPVIDAMNRAGITKMLLPKSLGGLVTRRARNGSGHDAPSRRGNCQLR